MTGSSPSVSELMSRIAFLTGTISGTVRTALESVPNCKSSTFHSVVIDRLTQLGYETKKDVLVPDRGDGKRGRIDVIASNGFELLAIELDRIIPRRKSLYKIRNYPMATARIVVCRI